MERKITFYIFEVGTQGMQEAADGRFDLVNTPYGTIEASSLTRTEIRKAVAELGGEVKRGTEVYAHKLRKVVYKFTTEDLKGIATEREEIPLD